MNPFQSLREYELFVYTLQVHFASIVWSTLTVSRRGPLIAEVNGEMTLTGGYRLVVYEGLNLVSGMVIIAGYSYEVWNNGDKLYWYDSQPHPRNASLASTHPHHKHVPPDIKHNRMPAPGLTFTAPNLPFLIQEIENLSRSSL